MNLQKSCEILELALEDFTNLQSNMKLSEFMALQVVLKEMQTSGKYKPVKSDEE